MGNASKVKTNLRIRAIPDKVKLGRSKYTPDKAKMFETIRLNLSKAPSIK